MVKCDEMIVYLQFDEPIGEDERVSFFQVLDEHWDVTGEGDIFTDESPEDWGIHIEDYNVIYDKNDEK